MKLNVLMFRNSLSNSVRNSVLNQNFQGFRKIIENTNFTYKRVEIMCSFLYHGVGDNKGLDERDFNNLTLSPTSLMAHKNAIKSFILTLSFHLYEIV